MKIPRAIEELLHNKGVVGEQAINCFLFPKLKDLPPPEIMLNLQEASRLVAAYIQTGKKIIIWGDYDVDGTTATALLVNFFQEYNFEAEWHIPNRLEEGYGLNIEWFKQFQYNNNVDDFLVITVDCGISDYQVIEEIKAMGGKVIVTDHHSLPESNLPDCYILNPNQKKCGFHNHHLAGVGVAFYLAAGIKVELQTSSNDAFTGKNINLKDYLCFVALGTIADLVELTQTNRILVRGGLEALSNTKFAGLKALLISCEIHTGEIYSEDIGFLIGPKINAAGRLGKPGAVLHLLTEKDKKNSKRLALKLTDYNNKRKKITETCLESTLALVSSSTIIRNKCTITAGDIHQGVAGIVASRLVDLYKFPAIVFSKKELEPGKEIFIGSARSIPGISIIELFHLCSLHIIKYGGHSMAAGLTISSEKMEEFQKEFISVVKTAMERRIKEKKKRYDISCPVSTLMLADHLEILNKFEPYGPGNERPIFYDPAATIIDSKKVGRDAEHLNVTFRGKYSNIKGIGFGLANRITDIQKSPERTLYYTPTRNRFRGKTSWQVRVIDT